MISLNSPFQEKKLTTINKSKSIKSFFSEKGIMILLVNCADSAFMIFESIEPGDYGDSGDEQVVTKWSVGSGCQLSENIWFSWSKT